jgi:serine O-acetyltransferase
VTEAPLTWRETRRRLAADRARLRDLLGVARGEGLRWLALHPSYVCVFLYRLSHHLHRGGHRHLARVFWYANVLMTGADISAPADLGEGLVIVSPAGIAVSGKAGRNLTLMPLAGMGSELGRRDDIGGGPGLPVVGDDVVLEPNCGVLGPIRIGHRARVGAAVAVTRDLPDDCVAEAHAPRVVPRPGPA